MKIVKFMAFDKVAHHVFVNNETPEEMHAVLKNICFTYVPIDFIEIISFRFYTTPLETLKNLSTI